MVRYVVMMIKDLENLLWGGGFISVNLSGYIRKFGR